MDEFSLFILILMGLPIGAHLIDSYLKVKLENAKQKGNSSTSEETKIYSLEKRMEYLMAENEAMKEELRNIKHLLSSEDKRAHIDFDYEKEQMHLDNNKNKFEY